MFEVGAMWFVNVERAFIRMHERLDPRSGDESTVSLDAYDEATGHLLHYFDLFQSDIKLPVTQRVRDKLRDRLDGGVVTWKEAAAQTVALQTCWETELESCVFLGTLTHAEFYRAPTAGWESVITRFRCGDDVEESRKCLALGRYTASVFHMMKVVEFGVLELQAFVIAPPDPKGHFGGVINKLEDILQHTRYAQVPPLMQPKLPMLREALPQLHAVKDAWRDKVSHCGNSIIPTGVFGEDKAMEVHNASLALMRNLAAWL